MGRSTEIGGMSTSLTKDLTRSVKIDARLGACQNEEDCRAAQEFYEHQTKGNL